MSLYALIHPKLSFEQIKVRASELALENDHVFIFNHSGDGEVEGWALEKPGNVVGYNYVRIPGEGNVHRGRSVAVSAQEVSEDELHDYILNFHEGIIIDGIEHVEVVQEPIVEQVENHHEHVENLEDEEVEDNDVSDGSDSGSGTNPWVWDHQSS